MTQRYRAYIDDSIVDDDPYYVGVDKRLFHLEHPVGEYVLWEDHEALTEEKDNILKKILEIQQLLKEYTKPKPTGKRKSIKF